MAAQEKVGDLIYLNAGSVVGYLFWLGYCYVKALGSAFSSASHSSSDGGVVNFLLAGVAVAVVACAVGSFFAPAGRAKLLALAPLLLIPLAEGFIRYQKDADHRKWAREHPAPTSVRKRNLQGFSKDYVIRGKGQDDDEYADESFLMHDRELNTIVCIEAGDTIRSTPVGKVDGQHLDTLLSRPELVDLYKWYVDREGKKIYDRYVVRHRPDLDPKEFHLEKFQR